jgi:hypothetical protein
MVKRKQVSEVILELVEVFNNFKIIGMNTITPNDIRNKTNWPVYMVEKYLFLFEQLGQIKIDVIKKENNIWRQIDISNFNLKRI